jgi:hypothetical protein
MPLDAPDEARVSALEVFVLAMRDLINNKSDFDHRQYFQNREAAHTPPAPPEE